jgi:carboxymethylenebutenolidase
MTVRIPTSDGEFSGYLSLPRKGKGPGIVVLQEIFGVNASMRKICDHLAARQFTVLAPELYWRTNPGVELVETDYENARAIRAKTDDNKASDDAAAAIEFLRHHETCTGKVGVVGYCWGGLISYLTAVRGNPDSVGRRPDAAASYYGVGIDKRLDLAENLSCPLMLHYAGLDQFAGPDVAKHVRETFHDDPRVTVWEYPKAGHAFARPGGAHFEAASADLADMRSLSFFIEHLFGNRG